MTSTPDEVVTSTPDEVVTGVLPDCRLIGAVHSYVIELPTGFSFPEEMIGVKGAHEVHRFSVTTSFTPEHEDGAASVHGIAAVKFAEDPVAGAYRAVPLATTVAAAIFDHASKMAIEKIDEVLDAGQ